MAEKAGYQVERTLPALEQLRDCNVFTDDELKRVIKDRTRQELALARANGKKSDYRRAIQFEKNFDALRQKRVKRLGEEL